jgi:hypothetical protein
VDRQMQGIHGSSHNGAVFGDISSFTLAGVVECARTILTDPAKTRA